VLRILPFTHAAIGETCLPAEMHVPVFHAGHLIEFPPEQFAVEFLRPLHVVGGDIEPNYWMHLISPLRLL
jgi:hypothetical protein